MDSEVIGGRILRNRRSLATKRDDDKENALPKVTRTPAKTPARRKKAQSASETPLAKPSKKTFATLKEDEDVSLVKQELAELKDELNQARKDKNELEEQLKEALEMQPIAPATSNEDELEELRKKMAEMEEKHNLEVAKAAEKEALFQKEKEQLQTEKEKWKGQFEEFRQTETERLQQIDEEKEEKEAEEERKRELEEKEQEIEKLKEENKKLLEEKSEITEEKTTYSDAIESSLESLREKLSTVEIARKEASKLADDQKQLARDVMDTYDGKLVDMTKKYEKVKGDNKKNHENMVKYREERDKLREKLERYKERRHHEKKPKSPPRDPRNRGGSDDFDIRRKKDIARTGSKKPSVDIDPDELVLTSQYVFQEPYKKSSSTRVVLKPGDEPPRDAVKPEKNSCMPMRVAIEPRSDAKDNVQKVTVSNYLSFQQ